MNLALIGYRGTGKSAVARLLVDRLGWPAIDADEDLERRAGKSIKDIFTAGGEALFRDLEAAVVADLTQSDRQIISFGGGVILRDTNRAAIKNCCTTVWLRAKADTILARLAADPLSASRRPKLTTAGGLAEINELLAAREPLYRDCADYAVDTDDRDLTSIANEIVAAIGPRLGMTK